MEGLRRRRIISDRWGHGAWTCNAGSMQRTRILAKRGAAARGELEERRVCVHGAGPVALSIALLLSFFVPLVLHLSALSIALFLSFLYP